MENKTPLEEILRTTILKISTSFAVRGQRLTPGEIDTIRVAVAQALREANIAGRLDEANGKPPPLRAPDPELAAPGAKLRDTDPGYSPTIIHRRKSTRPPPKGT